MYTCEVVSLNVYTSIYFNEGWLREVVRGAISIDWYKPNGEVLA